MTSILHELSHFYMYLLVKCVCLKAKIKHWIKIQIIKTSFQEMKASKKVTGKGFNEKIVIYNDKI